MSCEFLLGFLGDGYPFTTRRSCLPRCCCNGLLVLSPQQVEFEPVVHYNTEKN
jgi:hypothetical protein